VVAGSPSLPSAGVTDVTASDSTSTVKLTLRRIVVPSPKVALTASTCAPAVRLDSTNEVPAAVPT